MFKELLIKEVHKYEHLWKVKSKNFKDVERVNNLWKEIASTKWKYLGDSYARLKHKCLSKSGDGAQSTSRNDDVVLCHTLPIFMGLGWCSIVETLLEQ